jgi:hypothetical protein
VQKANARTVVEKEMKNLREHNHQGENRKRDPHSHLDKQVDLALEDKRKAACCHMHKEIVVNNTEDTTLIEDMEFVVNSFTLDVMEMRTTLKLVKNVKASVMTPLIFVI